MSPTPRSRTRATRTLLALTFLLLAAPGWAQEAQPTSVSVFGDLQSEAGCTSDWDAACAATALQQDPVDGVWQGTLFLPAGSYQYRAALDLSPDGSYGVGARVDGANVLLEVPSAKAVKFYFDPVSHWVTDGLGARIVVAAGSFQSELGCPGDWQPDCLRSWLQDVDGDGLYTWRSRAIPAGDYDLKIALSESWDENYGVGGTPGGANLTLHVPEGGTLVVIEFDARTNVPAVRVGEETVATTTALAVSPTASVFGQAVTLTAQVAEVGGAPASGEVELQQDGVALGRATLDATGTATWTLTPDAVGTLTFGAAYAGTPTLQASAATPVAHVVARGATTTALSATPNPSGEGQEVVLSAQVSVVAPAAGVPGGSVTFQLGTSQSAPVALDVAGRAELRLSSLPLGDTVLRAIYAGDARFEGSTSATLGQSVRALPVALLTAPTEGQLLATRRPQVSGTSPAGSTVIVTVDGAELARVTAGAAGSFTYTPAADLAEGAHRIAVRAELDGVQGPEASVAIRLDTTPPHWAWFDSPISGATVNSARPLFLGRGEADAFVDILLDGVLSGTVRADATGAFSYQPTTALTEGWHTVSTRTRDAAGNEGTPYPGLDFLVDLTPPAPPVVVRPAAGGHVKTATPWLAGTAEAFSTVHVYVDGVLVGVANAMLGEWSLQVQAALGEGLHRVHATATDEGGNVSATSAPQDLWVDLTPPLAPILTSPADGDRTSGSPTFRGTAEPGMTVVVMSDGARMGEVLVDATGAWSFTWGGTLYDATRTAYAFARDVAGNEGPPSASVRYTSDATAPWWPEFLAPAPGSRTRESRPTFLGTTEPFARVRVYVDNALIGTAEADADGAWSLVPASPLRDGVLRVHGIAVDTVGNVGPASEGFTFTVDATAPAAPLILQPAQGAHLSTRTPTLQGSAEPGSTVTVRLDGSVVGVTTASAGGSWSLTLSASLAEGEYEAQAFAQDALGNVSVGSALRTFTLDVTAPAAPVVLSPAPGALLTDARPLLSGTAEAGARVTLLLDGAAVALLSADASGAWSWRPQAPLGEATHTLQALATDAADNVSAPSALQSFGVDATAPAVPILAAPLDGARVGSGVLTVRGSAEAGSTVTVWLDDVELGSVVADLAGAWTFTPAASLSEGVHALQVDARDAAGNRSARTAAHSLTVDLTAPDAPTLEVPALSSSSLVKIEGTAEAGSQVFAWVDGVEAGSTRASETGYWTLALRDLADGEHSVEVHAEDLAGNASARSAARTLVVDTVAPETLIVSGPPASTPETSATFELEASEPGATFECRLDGAAFGPCSAPAALAGLALGEHHFEVRARDAAGNADATPAVHSWTVVAPAPAPVTPPPAPTPATPPPAVASTGGCSAAGGAPTALLGLGVLALLRRRRRA